MTEFSVNGEAMVPLRCQSCGDQIGLQTPGASDNPIVVARCYACAAVEEAEKITAEAAQ